MDKCVPSSQTKEYLVEIKDDDDSDKDKDNEKDSTQFVIMDY